MDQHRFAIAADLPIIEVVRGLQTVVRLLHRIQLVRWNVRWTDPPGPPEPVAPLGLFLLLPARCALGLLQRGILLIRDVDLDKSLRRSLTAITLRNPWILQSFLFALVVNDFDLVADFGCLDLQLATFKYFVRDGRDELTR